MDILALLRGSPGAQAWMAQQGPALGALGISPREQLDREMSFDGSHPRQQEQAAINAFRGYGPQMLMDAFIPGYGAGGDAKAASKAYGEGRYGAAAGNALMAAMDFVPVLGALPAAAKGIRAFHGSPHDFDRFDMSKIGTGEGAQAYGHGLYFADNEDVARSYRDILSTRIPDGLEEAGLPFEVHDRVRWYRNRGYGAADILADISQNFPDYEGAVRQALNVPKGRMYEVNINADPEAFLDWDKPLGSADDVERFAAKFDAVDPALRKRIEDYGYVRQQMGQPMPDGNDIIREIMGGIGSVDAAKASRTMRDAGIPGIKYLDAGSRGAGDGSRNYVVFDDRLITILRKYGIGGLIAGGGAYALTDAEYAQAAELLAQDGMNTGAQ